MKKFLIKFEFNDMKIPLTILTSIGVSGLVYRQHHYKQQFQQRMKEIERGDVKLSGINIRERPASYFLFLGTLSKYLPKHQSLEIPKACDANDRKTLYRHVGLGPVSKSGPWTKLTLHTSPRYDKLNRLEESFPIEAWVDYYSIFGHFPENINPVDLNNLTLTREELETETNNQDRLFLSMFRYSNGRPTFLTCKSTIIDIVNLVEATCPITPLKFSY